MAVRDGAALDIDDVLAEAEFVDEGDGDCGKGFVDLDAFHRTQRPGRTRQRLSDSRHGTKTEQAGLDGTDAHACDPHGWLQAVGVGPGMIGNDHGRCAGVQAGRISRGDGPVLAEGGFETVETFQAGVRSIVFVLVEQAGSCACFQFDRRDLGIEQACGLGFGEPGL